MTHVPGKYSFEDGCGDLHTFATEGGAIQHATFVSLRDRCTVMVYSPTGELVHVSEEEM